MMYVFHTAAASGAEQFSMGSFDALVHATFHCDAQKRAYGCE
jgi:hypothetical protein